ncbi:MAG: recombination protein RecR [bacterium]|nr:recombination protein RecR [bacterium]
MAYPEPIEALMDAFQRFPGIGRRTAERLAFHVLRDPSSSALARAIDRALGEAKRCRVCGNVAQQDPCGICNDESRDASLVAVVEEPRHVEALERAGVFEGLYHVLMGAWQPAEGTDEWHLSIPSLIVRLREGQVRELILATDPDAEGEATAQLVLEALDSAGLPELKITRLARGLPAGAAIEYMHKGVIEDALEGRREVKIR